MSWHLQKAVQPRLPVCSSAYLAIQEEGQPSTMTLLCVDLLSRECPFNCSGDTSGIMSCASSVLQCRSTAETETQPSTASNGAEPSLQRTDSGRQARQAVAAKISAARALARKLSEEQQAAVTAAKLAAEQAMDEGEIDRWDWFLAVCDLDWSGYG